MSLFYPRFSSLLLKEVRNLPVLVCSESSFSPRSMTLLMLSCIIPTTSSTSFWTCLALEESPAEGLFELLLLLDEDTINSSEV